MRLTSGRAVVLACALAALCACAPQQPGLVDRDDVPTASELADHLLVVDDFGPGWEFDASDMNEDGTPDRQPGVITSEQRSVYDERLSLLPYFCPYGDTASRDVLWDAGTWLRQPRPQTEPAGPSVSELLLAAEPAKVAELFAAIRDVMAQCRIEQRDDYDPRLIPEYAGGYVLKRGETVDEVGLGEDRFVLRTTSAEVIPLMNVAVGGYGWLVLVRDGPVLAAITLSETFDTRDFAGELPRPTTDVDAVVATAMGRLGSDVSATTTSTETATAASTTPPSRPTPGAGSMTTPPGADDLLRAMLRPEDLATAGTQAEWYPDAPTDPVVLTEGELGGPGPFTAWACPGGEHPVSGLVTQAYTQLAGASDGIFDETSIEIGEWLAVGEPATIAEVYSTLRGEAFACAGEQTGPEGARRLVELSDVPAGPGEAVLEMTVREPAGGSVGGWNEAHVVLARKGPVLLTLVVSSGEPPITAGDLDRIVQVALDVLG